MSVETLQDLFYYAWDTFNADGGYQLKMGKLFKQVIAREMDDGTYRRYDTKRRRQFNLDRTAS
jgi:hypothetical protein